ncbi:MAG TPA: TniQ family protein [Candidatus Baltobacteraceae bacterium]|nr:TniQ family protein [Candidatus Baltobacteraceae bacterium]
MSPLRAFPLRTAPRPGESLDSWLEATAVRLRVTMAELYEAMGFASPHSGLWRHIVLRPTDTELAAICITTGLSPDHVRAMTLSRYADMAVGIDSGTGRFTPRTPWGRVHGSRFCPHCLRATGGAWKLQWRLIWTFACLEHRCLLADFCPECVGAQRYRYRIGAEPPRPGRCDNTALETTTKQHRQCGAALAQATVLRLAPEHPTLSAQAAITDAINSGIGDFGVYTNHTLPAANVLADVRALAQGILSGIGERGVSGIVPVDLAAAYRDVQAVESLRQQRRRIPGRKFKEKPPAAVTTAVAVTAAMSILGRPDVASAAEQLVSLHSCVDRRKVQLAVTGSNTVRSGAASPVLWAVHLNALGQRMSPLDQLRCRLGTSFPQRPAENAARRDRLVMGTPTMLWPTWSLRLCPPSLFQRSARLALSAAVLFVDTTVTVRQAAALLGGRVSVQQVVSVLWRLTKTDHWQEIRSALIQLADHLDAYPPPIDYLRRRHLDYTGLLPETAWSRICRRSGTRPEGASTARRYLCERLSGLPAFASPLPSAEAAAAASLALFPTRLTPELNSAMDEYASKFLAEQRISDEPVLWQPPTELLGGLRLPGVDISNVDVPELHRLIRQQQVSPGVAATHLAVSVDTIRVTLEEHPAPRQPRRPPAPRATVRRAGPAYHKASLELPRSRFVDLYEHQQCSLRDIAATIGVSKQTVTELARDYRIPLRRPQSPRRYTFDRDWLYREHVIKGRPLAELAREHGVSGATMTKNAKMHNIPVRRLGRHTPDALNSDENIPAVLKPALAGQGGWERLQRLAEIARFPTLQAAAAQLNTHRTTLGHQIALIERDLGNAVLDPADGHRGHELTAFGEEVVAAVRVLADRGGP